MLMSAWNGVKASLCHRRWPFAICPRPMNAYGKVKTPWLLSDGILSEARATRSYPSIHGNKLTVVESSMFICGPNPRYLSAQYAHTWNVRSPCSTICVRLLQVEVQHEVSYQSTVAQLSIRLQYLLPFVARYQQPLHHRSPCGHRGQNSGSLVRQSKGAVTFFMVPSHAETSRRADDICPSPSCFVASVRTSDWGSLASTLSQGCKLIAWSSL